MPPQAAHQSQNFEAAPPSGPSLELIQGGSKEQAAEATSEWDILKDAPTGLTDAETTPFKIDTEVGEASAHSPVTSSTAEATPKSPSKLQQLKLKIGNLTIGKLTGLKAEDFATKPAYNMQSMAHSAGTYKSSEIVSPESSNPFLQNPNQWGSLIAEPVDTWKATPQTEVADIDFDPFSVDPSDSQEVEPVDPAAFTPHTEDLKIVLSNEQLADEATVVETIEAQHYAKQAPKFAEQAFQPDRTNTFQWNAVFAQLANNDPESSRTVRTLTEQEGMIGLLEFLDTVVDSTDSLGITPRMAELATGLSENLTFLGEKEYKEATKGIAAIWKSYLDADPKNILCVPTEISKEGGKRKSDINLLENILDTMTDEELARYSGRLKTDLDGLDTDPAFTKIVMLDDWTISGSQMRDAYRSITSNPKLAQYLKSMEINLLAGSKNRLEDGFMIRKWGGPDQGSIPVKAYFRTNDAAETSKYEHNSHVTGTHSAVDFDFENVLASMIRVIKATAEETGEKVPEIFQKMPPLTNVVRAYRYAQPLMEIAEDGTITRLKKKV